MSVSPHVPLPVPEDWAFNVASHRTSTEVSDANRTVGADTDATEVETLTSAAGPAPADPSPPHAPDSAASSGKHQRSARWPATCRAGATRRIAQDCRRAVERRTAAARADMDSLAQVAAGRIARG